MTATFSAFQLLLRGTASDSTRLGRCIHYIAESGGHTFDQLLALKAKPDELKLYGPFLARALLEISANAIIGRLDPFRLLVLSHVQQLPTHNVAKPNTTSFKWQGDVFSDGKIEWGQDKKLETYPRAILGDCWDLCAWQDAFEGFVDAKSSANISSWVERISTYEPNSFIPKVRERFSALYSSLSKGIHSEFVLPPQEKFDINTISVAIEDTVFLTSSLLAITNFIDHSAYRASPEQVMLWVAEVEQATGR